MPNSSYKDCDEVYRNYPAETLPWELGKPRKNLINLIEDGGIKPGIALDACCGLGSCCHNITDEINNFETAFTT